MSREAEIEQALKNLSAQSSNAFYATVNKVDKAKCTIEVVDMDDLRLSNVQLRAAGNGEGSVVVTFPKVGSSVLCVFVGRAHQGRYHVINVSEIDSVYVKIGDISLEVDEDKIALNGTDKGGLVEVKKLDQNLQLIKAYFTAQNAAITTALALCTPLPGLPKPPAVIYTEAIQALQLNYVDQANKNVKHG